MSDPKITKMKRIISIMTIAAAAAVPAMVSAQNTYSGYFLENYTYGYEMNPAFGNNSNYVSMPALGNLNLSMRGTLAPQQRRIQPGNRRRKQDSALYQS